MGLLKVLFITICVMWLISKIVRLLLPYFFHKLMAKAQQQANQRYQQQHPTPDGRIRVDYMPPKEKSRGDHAGDFVDYEEVKTP